MSKKLLILKKSGNNYNLYIDNSNGMNRTEFIHNNINHAAALLGRLLNRETALIESKEERQNVLDGRILHIERLIRRFAAAKQPKSIYMHNIFLDGTPKIAAAAFEAQTYLESIGESTETNDDDLNDAIRTTAEIMADDLLDAVEAYKLDAKGEEKQIQIETARNMLAMKRILDKINKKDNEESHGDVK